MEYRLFLSHSTPPEARDSLRELVRHIENVEPGAIKVLYDEQQIVGSDDWRQRIAFMLHVCDGGVVLLDKAALSSDWVLAEATFLSLRQAGNVSFACIPVSFLDEQDLQQARQARARERQFLNESAWSVARLPAIQYVRGKGVADIAFGVVSALRAKGQLQPGSTPADTLADQFAGMLKDAARGHLQSLARRAEQASPYLTLDDSRLAAVAMVQEMLTTLRLTSVRQMINGFGVSVNNQNSLVILEELSPLALEGEASAVLRLPREGGGCAHASLSCQDAAWFIPRYVRRAYLADKPPACLSLSNTLGTFEELSASLRTGYRGTLSGPSRNLSDDQVDYRLRSGASQIYAWVPGPIDAELMARLDHAYPRVTFIVHHGPGHEPTALPPGVEQIVPPLTPEEENRIVMDYVEATESLVMQEWVR